MKEQLGGWSLEENRSTLSIQQTTNTKKLETVENGTMEGNCEFVGIGNCKTTQVERQKRFNGEREKSHSVSPNIQTHGDKCENWNDDQLLRDLVRDGGVFSWVLIRYRKKKLCLESDLVEFVNNIKCIFEVNFIAIEVIIKCNLKCTRDVYHKRVQLTVGFY